MLDFLRTLQEKDINSTQLGKLRKYNLARGDKSVHFKGTLIAFYHAAGDSLDPEAQDKTHLETIAIFKTSARYLIYYVLNYQNNEHITGRQVHVHATSDLDAADRFIQAMAYANKRAFAQGVMDDARAMDKNS